MKFPSILWLLFLFSISQAELLHFSLDSVSREEAVDFETGSRFHLRWASWEMMHDESRTAEGVVADYLLSPVGLLWCACDANAHVVFDTGYATLQTISELRSVSSLDLQDTTRFKPLAAVPDGYFMMESPFSEPTRDVRFILKDEDGKYALFNIRGFSEISTEICCDYYQCEYLVDIEWWYQTNGTPSFNEDVYIRKSSQIIRPAKQNLDKDAIYDIRGRRLPVSISGSGVRIRAEGGRFLRRIQLLQ